MVIRWNKSLRPSRKAFSLLELVVVVAVITIAAALIVPVIQKTRAASARLVCANNLKQLSQAAHAYHDVWQKFPPAVQMTYAQYGDNTMTDASYAFGPNWAVLLLPHLGQDKGYEKLHVHSYMQNGDQSWRQVRGKSIPVLLCPADSGKETLFAGTANGDGKGSNGSGPCPEEGEWARGNYAANAGTGFWVHTVFGGSDRMEIPANSGNFVSTSPVLGINFGSTIKAITDADGTANTILFNEIRIGLSKFDRRGTWAMGFPGASVTAASAVSDATAPNDPSELSDDIQGCEKFWYQGIGTKEQMGCTGEFLNGQGEARSRHTGGVNAGFVDGSVHFISNTVDQRIWACLLSPADGEKVTPP